MQSKFEKDSVIYEYTSAANPIMKNIPIMYHESSLHESGPTKIIYFDLSSYIETPYIATSPNLLAAFIRICSNENIKTFANATSQIFYIINGSGFTYVNDDNIIKWNKGDLFVLPYTNTEISHNAIIDSAIYWISDEPLLNYLNVVPKSPKFNITFFSNNKMLNEIEIIRSNNEHKHLNRLGILLGNKITENSTKTITHTLWSLLNVLPANEYQKPHRHNSVALDLCVYASKKETGKIYTLMGKNIDNNGNIIDPIKCYWVTGTVFVTPPGWWHSHHNETNKDAYVLPIQDAGLYTYQRTLDIQFT
jgi:gentisate 1,2-dioxygenase